MPMTETWWFELLKSLLPFILALVGAYLGYLFAVKKDRVAKRQELKIQYLIDAYRRLENCSMRTSNEDIWRKIESCIADIQLFGTLKQVEYAQEIARELAETSEGFTHDLLVELRKDLRKELGLDYSETIKYLRFTSSKKK